MNSTTRHEMLDKLYKDANYGKLKSNRSRIQYFLDHVMDFEKVRSIVQVNLEQAKQKNAKCLSLAKNFKAEADMFLMQASLGSMKDREENLKKALKSYTQAILYMPLYPDVEQVSKLYIRKSHVHFQLKEFDAALYSVNVAIDVFGRKENIESQPSTAIVEYKILKANCLKMLKRYTQGIELLNQLLSDDQSLKLAGIAETNLIDMRKNLQKLHQSEGSQHSGEQESNDNDDEEYYSYKIDNRCQIVNSPVVGRHFVAKNYIPEGTVLLEEKPYSIIIESDYLHKKCSSCFQELTYKYFPCAHCVELLFCDRKCFERAYKLFHRYECGFISVLKNVTSPSFHVFRMISRIGPIDAFNTEKTKQNYSIDEYMEEQSQRTVPELKKSQEEKLRAYKMSSILWDHNSKHSLQANVHHTIIGIEIAVVLDLVHEYCKQSNEPDFLLNFIDMVIVDTRRIIFNVFGWHEYNDDWTLRGHVANCQCLVGSLINHSCVPNTNWEFNNGQIRFITNRPIKQDEEITITYGPNKDIAYQRRQERLNHYYFACKCKVCVEDSLKGNALKCRSCSGPVPFETSVNQEPALSGQCLLCFAKYPEFEASVKEFYKCQQAIKVLEKLASHNNQDNTLLDVTINYAKRLADLFVSPNPIISDSMLNCSEIIQKFETITLEDAIEWGYFIDQHLLLDIPIESLKTKTLPNMFFWLKTFMKFIMNKGFDSREEAQAECKAWNTLFRYHYRIKEILQELTKNEQNNIIKTMMSTRLVDSQNQVEQLKMNYGQHLSFV